jgi:hypothetical protein
MQGNRRTVRGPERRSPRQPAAFGQARAHPLGPAGSGSRAIHSARPGGECRIPGSVPRMARLRVVGALARALTLDSAEEPSRARRRNQARPGVQDPRSGIAPSPLVSRARSPARALLIRRGTELRRFDSAWQAGSAGSEGQCRARPACASWALSHERSHLIPRRSRVARGDGIRPAPEFRIRGPESRTNRSCPTPGRLRGRS